MTSEAETTSTQQQEIDKLRDALNKKCVELDALKRRVSSFQHYRHDHSWKVGGDLTSGGIPTPFLFRLPPFPCYSVVAPPVFPFHSLLFSLTRPLNPVGRSGDVLKAPTVPSKMTVSCKSWRGGDQIHLVPKISKVGGDASHGYHRVVNALWFSTYPLLLTFNFVLRSVKWTPLLICIAFVLYIWLLKIENCHYGFLF